MPDYSDKEDKRKQESIASAEPESNSNENVASLSPPVFGPTQAPVQKKEAAPIQREEKKEGDKKEDKGVDIDIKVLPPSVQMAFWRFKLSADTSGAKLGYKQGDFGANLGYGYGSNLNLGVKKGPLSASASYVPGASDFSLGAGYKQGGFNAGLSMNPLGKSGSLSLGIGAPLAPMPMDFGNAMQAGGDAATNMMMQGPNAPFKDPMGYYNSNKDNIGDISKAAAMAAKLAKEGKGLRFGAGARLSASQLGGFTLSAGIQGSF